MAMALAAFRELFFRPYFFRSMRGSTKRKGEKRNQGIGGSQESDVLVSVSREGQRRRRRTRVKNRRFISIINISLDGRACIKKINKQLTLQ